MSAIFNLFLHELYENFQIFFQTTYICYYFYYEHNIETNLLETSERFTTACHYKRFLYIKTKLQIKRSDQSIVCICDNVWKRLLIIATDEQDVSLDFVSLDRQTYIVTLA